MSEKAAHSTLEQPSTPDLATRLRKSTGLDLDLKREAADELDRLNELREEDGRAMGLLVEDYNKMKSLCADGKYLTDEERHCLTQVLAINTRACFAPLRSILDRLGHGAAPENR